MPYKSKADKAANAREYKAMLRDRNHKPKPRPHRSSQENAGFGCNDSRQIQVTPETIRYRLDAIAALRAKEKTWGATSPWKRERKCA